MGVKLRWTILIATGALLAAAALAPQWRPYIAAIGVAALVALCAFVVGSALGFLFALPKAVSSESKIAVAAAAKASHVAPASAAAGPAANPAPAAAPVGAIAANPPAANPVPTASANKPAADEIQGGVARRYLETNGSLERISDWLSTMIIGIALTEVHNINRALADFRDFIAQYAKVFPIGQEDTAKNVVKVVAKGAAQAAANIRYDAGILPAICPLLLIAGALVGFLFMYLYTRLLLSPLFNEMEREIGGEPPKLSSQVGAMVAAATMEGNVRSSFLARVSSTGRSDMSVDEAIGRMFTGLYKGSPRSFTEVLEIGAALASTPATLRADYWFYMAAAYGQQHAYLSSQTPPESPKNLARIRALALNAATRAVNLDRAYRARLALLLDKTSNDDDLRDFSDDPDFIDLIKPRPS